MKKGIDYIGVGVGAIIFNEEGKVLIAKRGPNARNEVGKWEFPGGGVEFGEKCEDALLREIKEEFDIEIEITELLEVADHFIPDEKQHWVAPSYVAKYVSGEAKIMESDKIEAIDWVDIKDLKAEELSLVSRDNLMTYRRRNKL